MIKLPELLAPAGTLDAFKTAILYGADAIYAGLPGFSMRARAKITTDEVRQGIELAHAAGKKVYLAFNLFAHEREYANMKRVSEIINYLAPDALIVADPGVMMWVREHTLICRYTFQPRRIFVLRRRSSSGKTQVPVCASWRARFRSQNFVKSVPPAQMLDWKFLFTAQCV